MWLHFADCHTNVMACQIKSHHQASMLFCWSNGNCYIHGEGEVVVLAFQLTVIFESGVVVVFRLIFFEDKHHVLLIDNAVSV